jgi:hypothetical protein
VLFFLWREREREREREENSFDVHPVVCYEVLEFWYNSVRNKALLQINHILEALS